MNISLRSVIPGATQTETPTSGEAKQPSGLFGQFVSLLLNRGDRVDTGARDAGDAVSEPRSAAYDMADLVEPEGVPQVSEQPDAELVSLVALTMIGTPVPSSAQPVIPAVAAEVPADAGRVVIEHARPAVEAHVARQGISADPLMSVIRSTTSAPPPGFTAPELSGASVVARPVGSEDASANVASVMPAKSTEVDGGAPVRRVVAEQGVVHEPAVVRVGRPSAGAESLLPGGVIDTPGAATRVTVDTEWAAEARTGTGESLIERPRVATAAWKPAAESMRAESPMLTSLNRAPEPHASRPNVTAIDRVEVVAGGTRPSGLADPSAAKAVAPSVTIPVAGAMDTRVETAPFGRITHAAQPVSQITSTPTGTRHNDAGNALIATLDRGFDRGDTPAVDTLSIDSALESLPAREPRLSGRQQVQRAPRNSGSFEVIPNVEPVAARPTSAPSPALDALANERTSLPRSVMGNHPAADVADTATRVRRPTASLFGSIPTRSATPTIDVDADRVPTVVTPRMARPARVSRRADLASEQPLPESPRVGGRAVTPERRILGEVAHQELARSASAVTGISFTPAEADAVSGSDTRPDPVRRVDTAVVDAPTSRPGEQAMVGALDIGEASADAGSPNGTRMVREQIIERVLETAQLTTRGGLTSLRVRLHPESLGAVDVRLVERNGVVIVRLDAATADAREALETGIDHLRRGLAEGGLTVQRIEVSAPSRAADAGLGAGSHLMHFGQSGAEQWSASGQSNHAWRQSVARLGNAQQRVQEQHVPEEPFAHDRAARRSSHAIDYRV